jgi:hypothetical protein
VLPRPRLLPRLLLRLLGGDGLVVPVERLLLFGHLEIARDDGGASLSSCVLVRLGDERILPLPSGRHRIAVGLGCCRFWSSSSIWASVPPALRRRGAMRAPAMRSPVEPICRGR